MSPPLPQHLYKIMTVIMNARYGADTSIILTIRRIKTINTTTPSSSFVATVYPDINVSDLQTEKVWLVLVL